jgi:hypothetical protein
VAGIGIGVEVTGKLPGGEDSGPKIKRVIDVESRAIVEDARAELDRITSGSGELGPTLDSETHWKGDAVEADFTAGKAYDLVLEYGPEVGSWLIEAKFANALRFPILDSTGAVTHIQYVPRGKQVLHEWTRDQLRPHWIPAIDRAWPRIERGVRDAQGGD